MILLACRVDNDQMTLLKKLTEFPQSSLYWLIYIIGGLALLAVALVYQYVFEELPCVVCIQIRLWTALLVIVATLGLILRQQLWPSMAAQLGVVLIAAGLIERSYLLLGTEKGFVFGGCGFDVGLPSWFAIDQWLPRLFQVETSCGYTPELLFGVTMAESLMVLSVALAIVSISVFIASLIKRKFN